jgi:hypothetical protein
VAGIGPIGMPVSVDQAEQLRALAQPARYQDRRPRRRPSRCREAGRVLGIDGGEPSRGVVGKIQRVAIGLDDPGLATMLLAPLRVEALAATDGPTLDRLATAYGEQWSREIVGVTALFDRERDERGRDQADLAWLETAFDNEKSGPKQ